MTETVDKPEKLEEKYLKDEIEGTTYKKWFRKYSAERSALQEDMKNLRSDHSDKFQKLIRLFPYLENLLSLFDKANLQQMHSMLRLCFKHTLIFNRVSFETAWLNPAFSHNYIVLKEKGLLL